MGRKIEMKKIENLTKRQVTFSKRRSSVMKKVTEISICCDVDVAFVAFSSCGRVSKSSKPDRIEDVIERYVNLPADKRLNHINNVEAKVDKLKQLCHIHGDYSKLQYLDKQIENIQLQITKKGLQLHLLEAELRDYELGPEQAPSLGQLSWCETNLNDSLQRVMVRKELLMMEQLELNQIKAPNSSKFNGNDEASTSANPISGQILMQLDPWISPYSARVREGLFQDLLDQGKYISNYDLEPLNTHNFQIPSNYSIQESSATFGSRLLSDVLIPPAHIPVEQQLEGNQALLNFHDQINANAWNNTSSAVFSDATYMSNPIMYNTLDPRFASSIATTRLPDPNGFEITQSLYDDIGSSSVQYSDNPNLFNQFYNMEGQEPGGQLILDQENGFTELNHNAEVGDYCQINCQMQNIDQLQNSYVVQPPSEAYRDANCGNLLSNDTHEDNTVLASNIQRTGLWEWDDLLLDQNFNFQQDSQV